MVRYGAYDGRLRMSQAKALAREHADGDPVHSWVNDQHFVVAVDDRKLVIDLLRGKYDIVVGGDVVGKFTAWEPAAEKFEAVLTAPPVAERASD